MNFQPIAGDIGCRLLGAKAAIRNAFDRWDIINLLGKHGALLLRDFQIDATDFDSVTRRLGRVRPANIRADTSRAFTSTGTQRVNDGGFPIPLHAESYYTPICPQILAFFCEETTVKLGGETTLCDGERLFESFSSRIRQDLEGCRIVWTHDCPIQSLEGQTQMPLAEFLAWCQRADDCEVVVNQNAGTIHLRYSAPAIRLTWWGSRPAFANNLLPLAGRSLLAKMAPGLSDDLLQSIERSAVDSMIAHTWRPGDLLLVDNTRIMHGRTGWSGGVRNILVRMLTVESL